MTIKIKRIAAVGVLILVVYFAAASFASANPSFFFRKAVGDSFATTTGQVFIRAGVATTTLVLDSGVAGSFDSASLLIQYSATNSATTLNTDIQYSQDCVDYYASNLGMTPTYQATSSDNIGPVQTITFPFASSTIDRAAFTTNGGVATSTRIVLLSTPTRCTRAVFYVPAGAGPGSFWAEFVTKKQNN